MITLPERFRFKLKLSAPDPLSVAAVLGVASVTAGVFLTWGLPVALIVFGAFNLLPVVAVMFKKPASK